MSPQQGKAAKQAADKKKKRIRIAGIVIAVVAIAGWLLYDEVLRGLIAPFGKAPYDIGEAINNTEFPLELPDGFEISVFAEELVNPRVLMYEPGEGTLFASITSMGQIVALRDKDGDGKADANLRLLEGLNRPHGLAMACKNRRSCHLYIAESDKVSRFEIDPKTLNIGNGEKLIDLPGGGFHFTRTLMITEHQGRQSLLISVGSSCNVCDEEDWRRGKILIADLDGNDLEEYATGLRNAVFMATNPTTQEVWVTEMGRDFLGDDLPPDEINILAYGRDYGWPICYGQNVHDTDYDKNQYVQAPCRIPETYPAHFDLPAHSAPLGLAFIPREGWPAEMHGDMLVAFHGSWNRSIPTGYKITQYKLGHGGEFKGREDFVSGWLTEDGKSLGRPADIVALPDGTAYVSDDKAGLVYKIAYLPTQPEKVKRCIRTGCGGEVCSDQEVPTACDEKPEYVCFRQATCEVQADGECGWTETPALLQCLDEKRK